MAKLIAPERRLEVGRRERAAGAHRRVRTIGVATSSTSTTMMRQPSLPSRRTSVARSRSLSGSRTMFCTSASTASSCCSVLRPRAVIAITFRRLSSTSGVRLTRPLATSSLTAATMSLRSIPVRRPRSAWLVCPHSSSAASSRKWYPRRPSRPKASCRICWARAFARLSSQVGCPLTRRSAVIPVSLGDCWYAQRLLSLVAPTICWRCR